MEKIHYQKDLNPAQREAVQAPDGPILVIAGAGSGKTRTLVYRVAWLVEQGISPQSILLLTFTRKAAQEMLTRVEEMLGTSCREVAGGTFHALAYRVLRRHGGAIGLTGPLTVMDRADAVDIMGRLGKSLGFDRDHFMPGKKDLVELISRMANRGEAFEAGIRRFAPQWEAELPRLIQWQQAFEQYKRDHFLLDYDDLLILALRLFEEQPETARRLSAQYQYVLVDEYQDTNLPQAQIVRHLTGVHGNIMVVGDDSQSIYGFRGAHFKNILEFPRLFPGARIVKLEENYRSSQAILDLANKVISFAPQQYSKCLRAHYPHGDLPRTVEFQYEEGQSQFVVNQVRELARQGVPLREMAVLFRAGHHSFNLEINLQKNGIPFAKYGGQKLTEGAHIKDLLAYLKVARNPRDALSWERILKHLEGLGPKRAGQIIEGVLELEDWPDRVRLLEKHPRLQPQLGKLGTMLGALMEDADRPAEALETVWKYYQNLLPRLYEDTERRLRDIEELLRVSQGYTDLDDFLADLLLDTSENREAPAQDLLTLSTVHSAKGLEFQVVFVIWLTEGRFPSVHARESFEELEEERRLLYVAITRAKERLFLTYPLQVSERGGQWQRNEPCRFLAHLPEEIMSRPNGAPGGDPPRLPPELLNRAVKVVKSDEGYPVGLKVTHSLFGSGIVVEPPEDRKVRVRFRQYGVKVLHLDYARLKKG